jgi:hypothetical protein
VEWAAAGPKASAGLRPIAVQKVADEGDEGGTGGLSQMGLAQLERKFFSFSEFNFQCENISKKS